MCEYFAYFQLADGNLYHGLIAAVKSRPHTVTFATTNYELMIEHAISDAWMLTTYGGPAQNDRNISVLKIHGSCNFIPDVPPGVLNNATIANCETHMTGPVRVEGNPEKIVEYCRTETSLAPAIAVYAPGKNVPYAPEIVKQTLAEFHRVLASADVVYVIGLGQKRPDLSCGKNENHSQFVMWMS